MAIKGKMALSAVALVMGCSHVFATDRFVMELQLIDGSVAEIDMASKPVIKFDDASIIISGEELDVTHSFNDVVRLCYKGVAYAQSGIADIRMQPKFNLSSSEVSVDFGSRGGVMRLFNTDGVEMLSSSVSSGVCSLTFEGLYPGVYIVKANDSAFKIQIRK